jgi:hypothetical protein
MVHFDPDADFPYQEEAKAFIITNLPDDCRSIAEYVERLEDEKHGKRRAKRAELDRLAKEVEDRRVRWYQAQKALDEAKVVDQSHRDHVAKLKALYDDADARLLKLQKQNEKANVITVGKRAKPGDMGAVQLYRHARKKWGVPQRLSDAKLPKDASLEMLDKTRRKIEGNYQRIHDVQNARLPAEEGQARFKRAFEYEMSKHSPLFWGEFLTQHYNENGRELAVNADVPMDSLLKNAMREMMLSFAFNRIRELSERHSSKGELISYQERRAEIAKLRAEIDKLEIEEGRIIRALAAKGQFVALRNNTKNLDAIFGVEVDHDEIARRKAAAEADSKAA